MEIVNDDDVRPVCPHCEAELVKVVRVNIVKTLLRGRTAFCYVCPECRKLLGFSEM